MVGPGSFPPEVVIAVKSLACELPSRLGVPLSRFFVPDIHAEAEERGIVAEISGATIWRWLSEDAIKPWRHRSWIFPPRPELRGQGGAGARSLRPRMGRKAAGKTGLRALLRREDLPSRPASGAMRPFIRHRRGRCASSTFPRGGSLQYLAAWDVHRPRCSALRPKTGIEPFGRLVDQVMTSEPYASARGSLRSSTTDRRTIAARRANAWRHAGPQPRSSSDFPSMPRGSIRWDLLLGDPAQVLTPNDSLISAKSRPAWPLRAALRAGGRALRVALHRDDLALLMKKLAEKSDYQLATSATTPVLRDT